MFNFFKRKEMVYRENILLESQVTILKGALEQKDKEIAMWIERGNRLSAAYDKQNTEVEKMHAATVKLIESPTEIMRLKCKCKEAK